MMGQHKDGLKVSYRILLVLLLPSLGVVGLIALISKTTAIQMAVFTEDMFYIGGVPPYVGMLSNLGILLWSASASVCIFSGVVLRGGAKHWRGTSTFLMFSGLLTSYLLVDDFFMLHEYVFPRVLGLPSIATHLIPPALTMLYLVIFAKRILKTEFLPLVLALAFLVAALGSDLFFSSQQAVTFSVSTTEAGLKFTGIVCWFGYFSGTSLRALREFLPSPPMKKKSK